MANERPAGVPAEAKWVEDDKEWMLGSVSAEGRKQGPYKFWRADGTLCNECNMVDGQPHGPFKRFHENGEVSQEGSFENGELHGTRTWFSTESETTERMHEGRMSKNVWRSEMDYVRNTVVAVRHFDKAGQRLLPSGEPFPERPASVSAEAEYHEKQEQWASGNAREDHSKVGRWRYWYKDGTPKEDLTYVDGKKSGPAKSFHENGQVSDEGAYTDDERHGIWKRYGEDGKLLLEATFKEGSLHGRYTDWDPDLASTYVAEGVLGLLSEYDEGLPSGGWHLLGASNKRLLSRDFGAIADHETLVESPALANVRKSAVEWLAVAETCMRERRFAEAIVAHARAAGRSAKVEQLTATIAKLALPATAEGAERLAGEILESASEHYPDLLAGFLRGASPASLCRALAIAADKADQAFTALDLINAALLLAPEHKDFLFTRGLVLMRLGLPEQVKLDVQELATVQEGSAAFLGDYNRVLFRKFDFWPSTQTPETYYDGLPDGPEQDLEAIRKVIGKYAKRLSLIRRALTKYVRPEVPWMLADLDRLAAGAELVEDSWETDEDESISIDETLSLDEHELPDLLRMARADWAALTWLCWSVGESTVGLPTAIKAPANFGKACGMAVQRYWRVRDKVHMNGYGARHSNVPGFTWEGIDIDAMHPALAGIAEQEYAEVAAVFRWLTDESNRSPWQDNLRGS
ncbi:MAG: toxin-antitoxin system YwqK family antitoxin [Myxococcota bacterium]|nr:thiol reductase thioredoxin [Myxococcota bacterium]